MKKYIFTSLLFLLHTIHLWSYDVIIDDIYYDLDLESLSASVVAKNTNGTSNTYTGDVVIPESIMVYINKQEVTFVVTSVKDFAFGGSENLISVQLPNTIKNIGSYCFQECYKLKHVNIPESLESIGSECFVYCANIVFDDTLNLPNIKHLGMRAFSSYNGAHKNIKSVLLGKNLEFIGMEALAFYGFSSIEIPQSVKKIESSAFQGCKNLMAITLPDGLEQVSSMMFYDCDNLRDIKIGENTKRIDMGAFSRCRNIKTITVSAKIPPQCYNSGGFGVFENYNAQLFVPIESESLYREDETWSKFLNIYTQGINKAYLLSKKSNIYGVSGVKQDRVHKGVNIINGHKMIIK